MTKTTKPTTALPTTAPITAPTIVPVLILLLFEPDPDPSEPEVKFQSDRSPYPNAFPMKHPNYVPFRNNFIFPL